MISNVSLVCRAKEIIKAEKCRMVEIDSFNEKGAFTFRFKVRHWSHDIRGKLFSIKEGSLMIIIGKLINDDKGETIIVCEKLEFLDKGERKIVTVWSDC